MRGHHQRSAFHCGRSGNSFGQLGRERLVMVNSLDAFAVIHRLRNFQTGSMRVLTSSLITRSMIRAQPSLRVAAAPVTADRSPVALRSQFPRVLRPIASAIRATRRQASRTQDAKLLHVVSVMTNELTRVRPLALARIGLPSVMRSMVHAKNFSASVAIR